jgi:hypothetical protein
VTIPTHPPTTREARFTVTETQTGLTPTEIQPNGTNGTVEVSPAAPKKDDTVVVHRRTIDALLVAAGAVVVAVLVVAGALLTWGSNFAEDYVNDELTAQQIFFSDDIADERPDLAEYAGQQVTTGPQAEAYASYIDGHLAETADGLTYAQMGGPAREAQAAVTEAQDSGADEATVAELQATADELQSQRDTLFRGETLRGLLLSTFAWSTIGRIAGIAAIVAFVAAGVMLLLVVAGLVHRWRVAESVKNATA